MRGLILFLALVAGNAAAEGVDAEGITRVLDGVEASLKIDTRLFEAMTERERLSADERDLDGFRATYSGSYAMAHNAAGGDPGLNTALRQHQAKLRQCDKLLEWKSARPERERLGLVNTCHSELAERRAMVEILLLEATGTPSSDPR